MAKLAIIPARGGSKRIPRKNIKDFCGKPIIAYAIETAIKSNLFDEVMVSTDDPEIAEIAQRFGANVPFMRSAEMSNDFATTYEVIEEVLSKYKTKDITFESACCIYPCSPLISLEKLVTAAQKLGSFDTVFPIVQYSFPIQRALLKDDKDCVSFSQPDYALVRSQDLTPSFHDAGQYYWINIAAFEKNKTILSKNTGGIVLSEIEVQDIDNEIDWQLAELKYKLLHGIS